MKIFLELVESHVLMEVVEKVRGLLMRFPTIFSTKYDLGRAMVVNHGIDTVVHHPFRQMLRMYPNAYADVTDEQIDHMLHNDVIELAQSVFASNVVLVRKADGSMRFGVLFLHLCMSLTYAPNTTRWSWTIETRTRRLRHEERHLLLQGHAVPLMQCPGHFPEACEC